MATVSKWNPFGVSMNITATGGTVTRTSATKYTVKINASWETYYSGNKTNYGMTASSGGSSATINTFGTKASSGSGSFTGTYSISGNGSATKTITVTFKNFNTDNGDSATKTVSFNVTVPAWTSYKVTYNANGGSGAPSSQTKWKDQTLTLSSTKPTRTGYSFLGWSTSSSATSATYAAGAKYTANAAATLYAVWKINTYTVTYNANGGTLGSIKTQTKTYGQDLTLTGTATRSNYNFLGWATSASSTTVITKYTANAATTLYAVWELAYVKPRITNVSVNRCDVDGIVSDEGTFILVNFDWEIDSDRTLSSITVSWASPEDSGSAPITASGTSGNVNNILGDGLINSESSYKITLNVTDDNGYNEVSKTVNSQTFTIDILKGGKGVSIGKTAKVFQDTKGNVVPVFDVQWLSRIINHLCIGEKTGYLDGKTGIFLSNEGFIHLQRSTAQNYNPYIAFLHDDETAVTSQIQLDVDTNKIRLLGADGYEIDNSTTLKGHFLIGNKTGYVDGNTGVYINKDGYIQIQRSTGNPYITFWLNDATTWENGKCAAISFNQSDGMLHFDDSSTYFEQRPYFKTGIRLGYGTDGKTVTEIGSYWADGAHHYLVEKAADGLTTALGWAGSSDYATITKIRGRTCQYQNSSGTATLSDERLKKDFVALDKWGAFFDALEPCAFKMKAGTSGRYHLGFKAQQVEEALLKSGLTTQDFAGFIKMPYKVDEDDPERSATYEAAGIKEGADEYGLIYSEFTALNTYKIQQLQKENEDLKKKVDDLETRLAKLEAALNI